MVLLVWVISTREPHCRHFHAATTYPIVHRTTNGRETGAPGGGTVSQKLNMQLAGHGGEIRDATAAVYICRRPTAIRSAGYISSFPCTVLRRGHVHPCFPSSTSTDYPLRLD